MGSFTESSRGINSTNSSSANLSDTSFSSGGSAHTANLPHPGAHGEDQNILANLVNRGKILLLQFKTLGPVVQN